MLAHDPQERFAIRFVSRERTALVARHSRRLRVGFAGHDRRQRRRIVAAGIAVVGQAARHEQRAEIGIAEAQRPVGMAVLRNRRRRVARVVDENLLRRNESTARVLEGLDVELAVGTHELHQVDGRQVARRVVQEHVLGARVRRVDARRVRAGMPLVDGRVELHAGITANVGAFGDEPHQITGLVGVQHGAIPHRLRRPVPIVQDRAHELVGDAHAVVRVLEEDRCVRRARERAVIAGVDERPRLLLFLDLAVDELDDVRVIGVEDDHLRRAPRLAARLDDTGKRVVALHERHGTRRSASACQHFLR